MSERRINFLPGKAADIYEAVMVKPENRDLFSGTEERLDVPVYLAWIVGLDEESAYVNRVFDLEQKLKSVKGRYLRLEAGLPRSIPAEWMAAFNERWAVIAPMRAPKAADICEIFLRSGLPGSFEALERAMVKSGLSLILGAFITKADSKDIIKNFFAKQIYWLQLFFINRLAFFRPGENNSKVLFWGAASRDEAYFLWLLSALGCDVLCFDPGGKGKWPELPYIEDYSFAIRLPLQADLIEFPRSPRGKQEETVAYRAQQEIDQMLHNPETGAFNPWQLEEYFPAPFTLTTTLDEMLILWRSEARFRTGFEVRDSLVMIPSIFAKISGVTADLDEYLEKLQTLGDESLQVAVIKSLPLVTSIQGGAEPDLLDQKGLFIQEKVVRLSRYPFARLRPAMQKLLIQKMNELASLSGFMNIENNSRFRFRILNAVLSLDRNFQDMLQKFDYPFHLPKLLVFNRGDQGLNEDDAILLAFFHLIGFDIVIVCPGGYSDLEQYFTSGYYQVHRLEKLRFDLQADILDKKPHKGFLDWLRH